jgi:predicted GIY-YIG superfamily endonuclease
MDINYTYLYKLIKEESNDIFYIVKTNDPHRRFYGHRNVGKFINQKFSMEIIDKFIDKEDESINKHINEGHKLLNVRKNDYILKEYNVGDKIIFDPYLKINKMFK